MKDFLKFISHIFFLIFFLRKLLKDVLPPNEGIIKERIQEEEEEKKREEKEIHRVLQSAVSFEGIQTQSE